MTLRQPPAVSIVYKPFCFGFCEILLLSLWFFWAPSWLLVLFLPSKYEYFLSSMICCLHQSYLFPYLYPTLFQLFNWNSTKLLVKFNVQQNVHNYVFYVMQYSYIYITIYISSFTYNIIYDIINKVFIPFLTIETSF